MLMKIHEPSPSEIRAQARAFAREHTLALATEMLALQDTGVLGAGRLRELTTIWDGLDLKSSNSLALAQSTVSRAILESWVASGAKACTVSRAVLESLVTFGAKA